MRKVQGGSGYWKEMLLVEMGQKVGGGGGQSLSKKYAECSLRECFEGACQTSGWRGVVTCKKHKYVTGMQG